MNRNRHQDFVTLENVTLILQILLLLLLLFHKISSPEHACLMATDQFLPPRPVPPPHCCHLASVTCPSSKRLRKEKNLKKEYIFLLN